MTDWGVHLLDFALFGMEQYVPKSINVGGRECMHSRRCDGDSDTMTAVYDFGGFSLVWDNTIGIYGANYGKRGLAWLSLANMARWC
jgi:predicted dehydrogenase